jgi:hypothetical protein
MANLFRMLCLIIVIIFFCIQEKNIMAVIGTTFKTKLKLVKKKIQYQIYFQRGNHGIETRTYSLVKVTKMKLICYTCIRLVLYYLNNFFYWLIINPHFRY